ncbi:MAG: cystathionine gamma-synthase [Corynebacterium sp.]|nr:cystathionine gamma-synthase [Corynebacterium sp.]
MGFSTDAVHAGYEPDDKFGSINVPIYASTTFQEDDINKLRGGYEYTRCGNPTIDALEKTVAKLEGGAYCRAFSSGMAAVDVTLRAVLRPGDHVVFGDDAYGGTFRLLESVYKEWGIEFTVVDTTDAQAVAAAILPNTKLIWLESPTNPALGISDIAAIAEIKGDALLAVDNTFASPYLQRPLELGADISVHSTTKYIGGHSDVIGGAIITNSAELDEAFLYLQGSVGPVPSVFDAYLTLRGIKTLAVRMERHCDNAEAVVKVLAAHPKVAEVLYPGLPDFPGHEVAARQMKRFGGMVTVRFVDEEASKKFATSTKLIALAESLGGVESLLEHPYYMSHQSVRGTDLEPPKEFVRMSIGIEDAEDLIADIQQALDSIG